MNCVFSVTNQRDSEVSSALCSARRSKENGDRVAAGLQKSEVCSFYLRPGKSGVCVWCAALFITVALGGMPQSVPDLPVFCRLLWTFPKKMLSSVNNLSCIWFLFFIQPLCWKSFTFYLYSRSSRRSALPHSVGRWLKSAFIFHPELQSEGSILHITICLISMFMKRHTYTGWPLWRNRECFAWRNDIITNWSFLKFWQQNNMLLYMVAIATGPFPCRGMSSAAERREG